MTTVGTVSEGSELSKDEFSTAHTTDEVTSFEESMKKANNNRSHTVSTVSKCSELSIILHHCVTILKSARNFYECDHFFKLLLSSSY